MLRKVVAYTILVLFCLQSLVLAAPQDMTALEKLTAVEKALYGNEQDGALIERVERLEKDIYGKTSKDPLLLKTDKLYAYIHETSAGSPSFLLKLNAVEWTLTHAVTAQPARSRMENLERTLMGNSVIGSFDSRLAKLMQLSFFNGQIEAVKADIAKDTLVKIKLISPLSTRSNRVGDIVSYQAADDVYANGTLVIAKGAVGTGKVTKVEPARNFGRDAQIEVSFDSIIAVDNTQIATLLGEKAKEETKSLAKAAGATVAGLAILGPVGIVGGAFVHGKDIEIPAGAEMYIQTKLDREVYGLEISRSQVK